MKPYSFYLAGDFCSSSDTIQIKNSFENKVVAEVCMADENHLEQAIQAAQSVEKTMAHLPAYKKYEILMHIASLMKEHKNRLAEVLCNEACKPIKLALGEVDRAVQVFVVAAEEARRLPKEYMSIDWTPAGEGKEGFVKYFPIGLIAGISPFNFPMNLAVHKIAPAMAAGCPIILKPSSSTPLSTLELAALIDKTELPKGALSVLPMNRETGNRMVSDDRFKLLTFTGSPEVGWKMKTDAGKKKVVLELGGNAGVIISSSADVNKAVEKCVIGGFSYAGQVCIHTQRIFVHEKILNEFTQKFVERTKQLKAGPAADLQSEISSLIDEKNAIRVESWIYEALQDGAMLHCGGKRRGAFIEPTILSNTKNEMKVNCCEIFGPVVIIEPFASIQEAVLNINNSRFGLQAGLFTDSVAEMDYAFNHVEVGGLMINDVPTFRVDHMPYGGVKDSGLGREGVKYAIMDMLEPRLMVR
jgi:glyceraldehyde-3-phosphate dehydrogenase (NADP+)